MSSWHPVRVVGAATAHFILASMVGSSWEVRFSRVLLRIGHQDPNPDCHPNVPLVMTDPGRGSRDGRLVFAMVNLV